MTTNNTQYMDWSKRIPELTEKADNGDREAINILHDLYYNEKDQHQQFDDELMAIYNKGADENKPYSLYQLAIVYLNGCSKDKDMDKGINYLTKSMNVGCSQAYVCMAILNKLGVVNNGDYDTMLKKAMDMDNSNAYLLAALDLMDGSDDSECESDDSDDDSDNNSEDHGEQIVKYLEKSIEFGNTNAIHQLGQYYHDLGKFDLATQYYLEGCERNNEHCFFNLAVMYREGEGVGKNIKKSLELFQKAIDLGSIKALTCIGSIYAEQHDYENAKKYYRQAVDKDDPLACFVLGKLYMIQKKYKEAIKIFIKGATLDEPKCMHKLFEYGIDMDATDENINGVIQMHKTFSNFGAYDGFYH